jgi:hypothetical protein
LLLSCSERFVRIIRGGIDGPLYANVSVHRMLPSHHHSSRPIDRLNLKHIEKLLLYVGAINVARLLNGSFTAVAHIGGFAARDPADVLIDLIPNELAGSFSNCPEDPINLAAGLEAEGFVGIGRLGVYTQGEINWDLDGAIESDKAGKQSCCL